MYMAAAAMTLRTTALSGQSAAVLELHYGSPRMKNGDLPGVGIAPEASGEDTADGSEDSRDEALEEASHCVVLTHAGWRNFLS